VKLFRENVFKGDTFSVKSGVHYIKT